MLLLGAADSGTSSNWGCVWFGDRGMGGGGASPKLPKKSSASWFAWRSMAGLHILAFAFGAQRCFAARVRRFDPWPGLGSICSSDAVALPREQRCEVEMCLQCSRCQPPSRSRKQLVARESARKKSALASCKTLANGFHPHILRPAAKAPSRNAVEARPRLSN